MNGKVVIVLFLCVGYSYAGLLLGKNSILSKAADVIGINNLVSVDADARAKILGNEVGIDGAVGIGKEGIGAHASADADVLGQKANVHADILEGHAIDKKNHEVYKDQYGRQYVLQRQYVGTNLVFVRKYLDNGQIYYDGSNGNGQVDNRQKDGNYYYDESTGQIVLIDPTSRDRDSSNFIDNSRDVYPSQDVTYVILNGVKYPISRDQRGIFYIVKDGIKYPVSRNRDGSLIITGNTGGYDPNQVYDRDGIITIRDRDGNIIGRTYDRDGTYYIKGNNDGGNIIQTDVTDEQQEIYPEGQQQWEYYTYTK